MFYQVRKDCRGWIQEKINKNEENRREKKSSERMQEFILTYPSGVSSEEGINVHWETMMTRQRKERGRGRKEHDPIKVYTEQTDTSQTR